MNQPLVSIIMPTYNCDKYISSAINSVLNQTYQNWELLITDDCSTDDTVKEIKKFLSNSKIHLFKLNTNNGTGVARQNSINHAKGKYVAFLDGDDLWHLNKLEKQIYYMEKNNIVFSCTGYQKIKENGTNLNKISTPPPKIDYNKCLRVGNPIGNLTAIYNQEIIGKVKIPDLKRRNDFALWLRILKKTKYCYGMNEILASYRVGSNSSISKNKIGLIKYHWQLYYDIECLGFLRSCFEVLMCILYKLINYKK